MGVTMQVPRDAVLLRIFFGEDDKFEQVPLYEAIVLKAREKHLAGETVLARARRFRAFEPYTHDENLAPIAGFAGRHRDRRLAGEDRGFLPVLDTMMTSGLVTIEKVQVLQYGTGSISSSST